MKFKVLAIALFSLFFTAFQVKNPYSAHSKGAAGYAAVNQFDYICKMGLDEHGKIIPGTKFSDSAWVPDPKNPKLGKLYGTCGSANCKRLFWAAPYGLIKRYQETEKK